MDTTGTPATTRYFYSGWQVIEERDGAGSTTATYVYGNTIDDVVTAHRSGTNYYYHADDQHNVMAVTDATGAVVERYEYNDYGQPLIFDNSGTSRTASAIGNSLMFTGRAYDAETGLYYYRTRYYDPILGRFTTRDTIGAWGDPTNLGNGYAYVGNNPWTMTDPMGLGSYWQDFKTGFSLVANPVSDFIGAAHDSMDNLLYDPTSTVLYQLVKGDPQTFMNTMDRTLAVGAASNEMLTLGLLNDGEQCERSNSPVYKRTKHVTEKVFLVYGAGGVVRGVSSFALRKLSGRLARDEIANLAEKIAANERAAAAELRPYGGPGGGHHVPAKSAFTDAAGYDANKALTISNAELERLGVNHGLVSGAQMTGYKAFAKTGGKLTWDVVESIETQALVRGGMQLDIAQAAVRKAIQALKASGVSGPTRIPWGG